MEEPEHWRIFELLCLGLTFDCALRPQFEANKTRISLDNANNHLNHRGGEEVLLDVGGQDATEAFEDVGHSDEARELLDGLLLGALKRGVRFLPSHLRSQQLHDREEVDQSWKSFTHT